VTDGWRAGLVAIFAGALALRLTALGYGLPAVYNADEVAIMSRALAFAKGDLNPHNFVYPTFYFYALFAWVGLAFVWQRLTGTIGSAAEFQSRFFVDPSSVYLAGRALSAVAGAMTTAATALLARTLFDRATGLVAAVLLAVVPLAVQDARYVKHDVPVTFVITAALWLMARCWASTLQGREVSRTALILPALVTGVAWSTHYYAVFLGVTLVLTAWDARRSAGIAVVARTAVAMAAIAGVVFFLLSPFILVEPGTALRDIVANRQIVVDRAADQGLFGNLLRYLQLLVTPGVSLPVAAFAAAGVVLLARRQPRVAVLLLSFPVSFVLFIANTVPASRYLNPVLPVVALFAAHAVVAGSRTYARPARIATALTAVLVVAAASRSVELVRFFAQPDTRTIARSIVERHVPRGRTLLIQPYSVPLHESREGLLAAVLSHADSLDGISTKSRLRLATTPWPAPSYRLLWLGEGGLDDDKIYVAPGELQDNPIAALQARGVNVVILKGFEAEPDAALVALRAALAREGRLLAAVSPYRVDSERHGPPYLHNTDAVVRSDLARPGPELFVFEVPERIQ
jgi:hypothetical protein